MTYAHVLSFAAMNRVTLALIVVVGLCVGSGAIGWHLRPDCPIVQDFGPATAALAVERLTDANERADRLPKELRKPTKPIYLRVHDRTRHHANTSDDSLLLILDWGVRSE